MALSVGATATTSGTVSPSVAFGMNEQACGQFDYLTISQAVRPEGPERSEGRAGAELVGGWSAREFVTFRGRIEDR
jgi:hypothetical protein